MKTFYSDYAQHCMRFYARHPNPKFHSDLEKLNWKVCGHVLKDFTDEEQDILLTIYEGGDTIPDNIYNLSVERNIKQDVIWKLVKKLEHKIAKRRNLI